MSIHGQELYFALMEKQNFGKIILCRADKREVCIGKDVFEILGIIMSERKFFVKNLLSGSTEPIIMLGKEYVVVADRRMLYSQGICCFAVIDHNLSDVCKILSSGTFEHCLLSRGVRQLGEQSTHQSNYRDIYIGVETLLGGLSVFDDGISINDILGVTDKISRLSGCKIKYLSIGDNAPRSIMMDKIYSNSTLALAVMIAAISEKTNSSDPCVYLRRLGDNIQMRINGIEYFNDAVEYLKLVSESRDMKYNIYSRNNEIIFELYPFYADIGLVGVKNYLKFDFYHN